MELDTNQYIPIPTKIGKEYFFFNTTAILLYGYYEDKEFQVFRRIQSNSPFRVEEIENEYLIQHLFDVDKRRRILQEQFQYTQHTQYNLPNQNNQNIGSSEFNDFIFLIRFRSNDEEIIRNLSHTLTQYYEVRKKILEIHCLPYYPYQANNKTWVGRFGLWKQDNIQLFRSILNILYEDSHGRLLDAELRIVDNTRYKNDPVFLSIYSRKLRKAYETSYDEIYEYGNTQRQKDKEIRNKE